MSDIRRGFTLIELLVVVAIIALLVTILMPSLQQAKKLAGAVTCLANIKNTNTALTTYCEDLTSGKLVAYNTWSDLTNSNWSYANVLVTWKYVADVDILRCPTYKVYSASSGQQNDAAYSTNWSIGYGLRGNMGGYSDNYRPYLPSQTGLDQPACIYPMFADTVQWVYDANHPQAARLESYANVLHLRHMEKANLVFGDSHAEARTMNQLLSLKHSINYMFRRQMLSEDLNTLFGPYNTD